MEINKIGSQQAAGAFSSGLNNMGHVRWNGASTIGQCAEPRVEQPKDKSDAKADDKKADSKKAADPAKAEKSCWQSVKDFFSEICTWIKKVLCCECSKENKTASKIAKEKADAEAKTKAEAEAKAKADAKEAPKS